MKFAIGTAEFIKNYGILKKNIKINECKKIIKSFYKNIDMLDTAPSYGNAEEFIGNYGNHKYKILTKINKIKSKKEKGQIFEINNKIVKSLKKLNRSNINTLILHDEKNINLLKKKKIKKFFENLKKKRIIKNFGISIYDLKKLENYLKIYKFDTIQIAMNIFSYDKKKIIYLSRLKKKYKFKLHARSIFFQGLIFKNPKKLNSKMKFIKDNLILLKENFKKKSSIVNFSLSAIDALKIFDYAVVGISCSEDYNYIKKYKRIKVSEKLLKKLKLKDNLLDLRNY